MELPELKGYLRKKSRHDRWQRRYFEATTHYLTYYKNRESEKLLACIDLWRTQDIDFNPADRDKLEFSIAIGEQSYLLKADSQDDAARWIQGLQARQHRPEGTPSEVFSLRSERMDAESDASSSEYGGRRSDYGGRRSDLGARPRGASSDTGSAASGASRQQQRLSYTEAPVNPLVPNADAIAAAHKYPMVNKDQHIRSSAATSAGTQGGEANMKADCCAPCQIM